MRALIVMIATLAAAPLAAADSVDGLWTTEEKDGQVRIGECGATRCGRLAKFLVPPPQGLDQRDIYNPDKAKRSRKLLGLPILTNFKSDGLVWRGTIYDPKSGKSYRSVLKRRNATTLEVKGCIGPFCQTQLWKKAD
ncbi:hypothetical protein A6F68_00732 [Tsuneonella dongtanensis]|uniref:DUF2147 domain-containing protein n=1 Tax=Tsuneonella dongtanensis TaxID=692370 RepID=A0A1B2AAY3_9SPHN|nr:DUF2147 domain-containing protein [Tsuneonella dongtanensis]ANY19261.1 hypothetical protein A6F68_00732 [Tsuneonella dongtanensis]